MEKKYIEDQQFDKIDFAENQWVKADYDNCIFESCNLSNTNLSYTSFADCQFHNCNLSLAKLAGAVLREVRFKDCKLLGLHFEDCDDFLFSVHFDHCFLRLSCFYKRKLKKTIFKDTNLQEADFTETDLTGAVFDKCDLSGAVFKNAVLEKADLRSSFNYSIDPELTKIKKAKFSLSGIPGLLDKYDIDIS